MTHCGVLDVHLEDLQNTSGHDWKAYLVMSNWTPSVDSIIHSGSGNGSPMETEV